MAGSVTTSPSVEHSDRVASSCAAVLGWIDVDDPRQIPRATTLAEIHDEKRALEGFFVRPQRRPRLCVEDRERAEQRLPMLDGNGRQQRVLLRRRLCRHARCDAAQRTRLPGERRLRATR